MTTDAGDDLQDRKLSFGEGFTDGQGVSREGFFDPSGQSPRAEYMGLSGINAAAQGHEPTRLTYGGATLGNDLGIKENFPSEYNRARMLETPGGHKFEFNDTPGGERIVLRHQSGAGVEMQPDGTVIVSSINNQVTVVGGSQSIIVEGDGVLNYKGNLTLNVSGDMNINCAGDFNVNARNTSKTITGDVSERVQGKKTTVIGSNSSTTVAGSRTDLTLGNVSQISKGASSTISEGSTSISSKGQMSISSETKYTNSSPNTNISADNLSLFGASGTIGGENIIMYNYNMHTTKTVHAQTVDADLVYGDLKGTAEKAITSDVTNSQGYAENLTGTAVGYTIDTTAADTTATALPTAALLDEYLKNSSNGIRMVSVDYDDYILRAIQNPVLPTGNVRARLRDPAFAQDVEFTSRQIAAGTLSPAYTQPGPNRYGRVSGPGLGPTRGRSRIGTNIDAGINEGFVQPITRIVSSPSAHTNPNNATIIGPNTTLANGISLSKFTGGANDGHSLPVTLGLPDRKQIARNYWLMSLYMRMLASNTSDGRGKGQFENLRLEVAEGYFDPAKAVRPGSSTPSITSNEMLDLRSQGRSVAFRLVGLDGKIALDETFDLALMWKNTMPFDRLILDYDNMGPDNELNAYVIVQIPNIPSSYKTSFGQVVETYFNDRKQGAGLIECLPDGNSIEHGRSSRMVDPEARPPVPIAIPVGGYEIDGTNGKLAISGLVKVGDVLLRSDAASAWNRMKSAAAADGVTLEALRGYKTYEEQVQEFNDNGPGWTDYPGTTNHGLGIAVDVAECGSESAAYKWLQRNAAQYGFYNKVGGEPWYWSLKST